MSNESLRFKHLGAGHDSVGEVVQGIAIKVEGKFFRRRATFVATTDAATGEELAVPRDIGTPLPQNGLTRKGIADLLVRSLGSEYSRGNAIKKGVFEVVKDTGRTLMAEGLLYDGKVALEGSGGVEIDSTITMLPPRLGVRLARRRLRSDGAGGLSFAKKK